MGIESWESIQGNLFAPPTFCARHFLRALASSMHISAYRGAHERLRVYLKKQEVEWMTSYVQY
jgi:hypothetical protein